MSAASPPGPDGAMRVRNVLIAAILVGAAVLFVALWKRDTLFGEGQQPLPSERSAPQRALPPSAATPAVPTPEQIDEAEQRWVEAVGHPMAWPQQLARPACDEVDEEMETLCRALDDRPRLRVAGEGSPCEFLREAALELAARPPAVSAELHSHTAMLGNVFHLFRVLGRERLGLLRDLVHDEGALAEPAAFVLYRWWISRDACDDQDAGEVGLESFYEYAGFAFQSIGGQAYLRRRPPRIEALACFYGLHGLDVAISSGHNPGGLDLLPELERCRVLVATQSLLLSGDYGAELERIAERWRARRPG